MAQEHDTHATTENAAGPRLAEPTFYKVLLHDDARTPRELALAILREVFHRSEADALHILRQVQQDGMGVAGRYTYEVAETKIKTVEDVARDNAFALRLSMEPEEG